MKFKPGDRVRIILQGHEDNGNGPHFGVAGTVVEARAEILRVPYVVIRDGDQNHLRICYSEEHLEFLAPRPFMMPEPEMELSEIEEAEYLMEELSK